MFNKFQMIAILMACACMSAVTASIIEDVDPILLQQQFVLGLVRRSYNNRAGVVQASHDDDCFNYYFDQQDWITKEYNRQYNFCKATAQAGRDQLTSEGREKRTNVIIRGNSICSDLYYCHAIEDILEFFRCYSNASTANYPVLYNLSVNTSDEARNFQVFYERIENDEKSCTTTAKNNYVNAMAISNTNLDRCLNGEPVPKPPTTETPPGTMPTSETERTETTETTGDY